jgi:hypothetical protein
MRRFIHILTTPLTTIIAASTLAIATIAVPAPTLVGATSWPEVTTGRFHSTMLGADRGYDIRGGATMIRSDHAGGHTVVFSFASGLAPNTEYTSHVHNAACSTGGGGHYQHEVGGAVDGSNEIWPTLTTSRWGVAFGSATHAHRARQEAQSIVIHDPTDGGRIACLDLA